MREAQLHSITLRRSQSLMQGPLRIVDFAVQIVDLCKALLEYHGHNALIHS